MVRNLRVYIVYLILIIVCCIMSFYYSNWNTHETQHECRWQEDSPKHSKINLSRKLEHFENIKIDIGNRVSSYFYILGLCILHKTDFIVNENYTGTQFFEHLPIKIPYDASIFDNIHNELVKQNITESDIKSLCGGCDSWEIHYEKIHHFWKAMRHTVHTMMDNAFLKSGLKKRVDHPIIHFRCADTPFIKQPGYHLQYYEFFKSALEKINSISEFPYSKVKLMSCNTHRTDVDQQKSCIEYTDSLKAYLNSIGYECEVVCGSNIDDFATLFYAPAVISTSSSFSFMSGFFGNGVFFSTENTRGKCESCNDWMIYEHNLPHEDVDDYTNTPSVIEMLLR